MQTLFVKTLNLLYTHLSKTQQNFILVFLTIAPPPTTTLCLKTKQKIIWKIIWKIKELEDNVGICQTYVMLLSSEHRKSIYKIEAGNFKGANFISGNIFQIKYSQCK